MRGWSDVTVAGIYAPETDTGGYVGALFTDPQARELFTDGSHVGYIDVAGTGASQDELRDRIAAALPDTKVQTGAEVKQETKDEIGEALSFVNYFLLAFGAIALLVGTFIIYNTFSMIVAQRLRELALLRAIGASRKQVGRSVVFEALVVGAIGSALGLAAGVGLAYGLRSLLNAFDLGLPEGSLQVAPRTIVVALVLGIVVTVVSAYAPARRAAKVPPVAAMREEFASTGDTLKVRTLIGAIAAVLCVLALVIGAQSTGGGAAAIVGLGALALVLAVLLAARRCPARSSAGSARSSRNRSARWGVWPAPTRSATRSAPLRPRSRSPSPDAGVGDRRVRRVGQSSVNSLVDKGVEADFVLTGPQGIGVPAGAAGAAGRVNGVAEAVSLHGVAAKIDDEDVFGTALSGPRTACSTTR